MEGHNFKQLLLFLSYNQRSSTARLILIGNFMKQIYYSNQQRTWVAIFCRLNNNNNNTTKDTDKCLEHVCQLSNWQLPFRE